MSSKTTYHYPDGSVTFDPTLIVTGTGMPSRIEQLERENAALRTVLKRWLKVADDCHREQQEVGYSEYNITVGLVCDTRALLDAARKEAQP